MNRDTSNFGASAFSFNHQASYSSSSLSSASSSNDWEHAPIVVGRVECFKTDTYHHVEDKNPYIIAHEIARFVFEHNIENVKVTINDIRVTFPLKDESIYSTILKTIENEKHFLKEEDFFIN